MPFKIACSGCNSRLTAKEKHIGRTLKCPKCGSPIVVADPNAQPASPAEPAPVIQTQPAPAAAPAPVIDTSAPVIQTKPAPKPAPQPQVESIAVDQIETVQETPATEGGFPNINVGQASNSGVNVNVTPQQPAPSETAPAKHSNRCLDRRRYRRDAFVCRGRYLSRHVVRRRSPHRGE